jgi:hypothetical protein
MSRFARLLAVGTISAMSTMGCEAQKTGKYPYIGGPHYFEDIVVSSDPMGARVTNRFEPKAEMPKTYYVAFFDDQGFIVRLRHIYPGQSSIEETVFKYEKGGKLVSRERVEIKNSN